MDTPESREYQERATRRKIGPIAVLAVAVVALTVLLFLRPLLSEWTTVSGKAIFAVSGMAIVEGTGGDPAFLVVHDNRGPFEARIGLVAPGPPLRYTPVPWPADTPVPVDLETLSTVPGSPRRFLAATSDGTVSLLEFDAGRLTVSGTFTLPRRPLLPNIEGLSLQELGSTMVAAWGHRGAGREPGRLFWGTFDLHQLSMGDVSEAEIRVPFPKPEDPATRHISEVKIDRAGHVWIASTNDPGDAGPFQSAVYNAGQLRVAGAAVHFEPALQLAPWRTFQHKVEAIEMFDADTRMALGVDDENQGGAIALYTR